MRRAVNVKALAKIFSENAVANNSTTVMTTAGTRFSKIFFKITPFLIQAGRLSKPPVSLYVTVLLLIRYHELFYHIIPRKSNPNNHDYNQKCVVFFEQHSQYLVTIINNTTFCRFPAIFYHILDIW